MTAAPAFGVSGTATTGYVPTVQADGSIAWAAAAGGAVSSVFTRTGAVVAGNADYLAVSAGGLTGATSATRYVGGTTSGAPASGTFAIGDFVVDRSGQVWICVTAGTPGTWACATKSRERLYLAAAGLLAETGNPTLYTATAAPSSQTVYAALLGLHAADVVTGVVLRNITAVAGSLPTTARFGIADSTGKILAVSGNLNALASWPSAANQYALSAPYTVLADGGYFACFVINGSWGSTQPAIVRTSSAPTLATPAISGSAPPFFTWAGQTDLPSVGATMTITGVTNIDFYMGFY